MRAWLCLSVICSAARLGIQWLQLCPVQPRGVRRIRCLRRISRNNRDVRDVCAGYLSSNLREGRGLGTSALNHTLTCKHDSMTSVSCDEVPLVSNAYEGYLKKELRRPTSAQFQRNPRTLTPQDLTNIHAGQTKYQQPSQDISILWKPHSTRSSKTTVAYDLRERPQPKMSAYYSEDTETSGSELSSLAGTPSPPGFRNLSASRSPSPLLSPPVELQDPVPGDNDCASCHRTLDVPCAIYKMRPCPGCTGNILPCDICNGSGIQTEDEPTRRRRDCGACVASGHMAICGICHGNGNVHCRRCRTRNQACHHCGGRRVVDCNGCDGRGRRRCPICQAHGWVETFDLFCPGDRVGQQARRHPEARRFPRVFWSRVEVVEDAEAVGTQ